MKSIDWNKASELGLIARINTEILHPLGLAMTRNPETGGSDKILVDDEPWEYAEGQGEYTVLDFDQVQKDLADNIS